MPIQIFALELVKAAQLLLGLGEGAVGRQRLAIADANRGSHGGGQQGVAAFHDASLLHLFGEGAVGAEELLPLGTVGGGDVGFAAVDEGQVTWHWILLRSENFNHFGVV